MNLKVSNRHFLSFAIILFYFVPLLFFVTYSIRLMPAHKSWSLLSIGLLIVTAGAIILILLLYYWEQALRLEKIDHSIQNLSLNDSHKENKVTALESDLLFKAPQISEEREKEMTSSLKEYEERQFSLLKELESKEELIASLKEEEENLRSQMNQITQSFADYKIFSEEQLKHKNLQISTLQQTIEEQQHEMEKRQDQIYQLDTKVRDLSYEIKTLLHLNAEEPAKSPSFSSKGESLNKLPEGILIKETFSPYTTQQEEETDSSSFKGSFRIHSQVDAAYLLKRCIHTAQKMSGAHYQGNEPSRYRDLSSHYMIDLRRLFDSLRNETEAIVLVYSQKENKVLFVNSQAKHLLGWSAEKFMQDFFSIIQEGMNEWNQALSQLSVQPDAPIRLLTKTKNGEECLLQCHLGLVPTGLFKGYVIGILYPI
jgi:PAS domain-containing protein